MVDDLLKLWRGVEVQTAGAVFSTKTIRTALGYISCDIPATRKVWFSWSEG